MRSAVTPSHRGGGGSPLVCLHGFMDTWRTWELVLSALERHHDVLAPTLPGHAGGRPREPAAGPPRPPAQHSLAGSRDCRRLVAGRAAGLRPGAVRILGRRLRLAADAFHVVLPSLPSYGFSDKPTEAGWNVQKIADAWARPARATQPSSRPGRRRSTGTDASTARLYWESHDDVSRLIAEPTDDRVTVPTGVSPSRLRTHGSRGAGRRSATPTSGTGTSWSGADTSGRSSSRSCSWER